MDKSTTISCGPKAALNDNRFAMPFDIGDDYQNIDAVTGDFDLLSLKAEAEKKALGRASKILRSPESYPTLTDKIFAFVSLARYRRGKIIHTESAKKICQKQIAWCESHEKPISITLSFFPCKVINPLKTFANEASCVDLGEAGSLLRFYEVAFGLSRFYKNGVKFVITADGIKYHDVFGYDKAEAKKYSENINKLIDYLGIGDYIQIIEETDLYPSDIEDIKRESLNRMICEYNAGSLETVELFDKLRNNIALSINCKDVSVPISTLASVFNLREDFQKTGQSDAIVISLRSKFERLADIATLKYMSMHRIGYQCDIYNKHLQHSLKATIHPKDAQIGLHAVNQSIKNIFPHHGQGHMVLGKLDAGLDDIRISFAADLRRQKTFGKLKALILDPMKYPFSDGKHPFTIIKSE